MSDIGSGIVGTFNQANLATRRAEAENSRTRKGEQQRTSEARRRYVAAQEEVEAAQTLRGRRVEPDKEETSGREARDQYESHGQLTGRQKSALAEQHTSQTGDEAAGDGGDGAESGQLIDIEA
ncbi:MAG: hypothetical protein GWP05_02540 [Anaerolineaceae bacterium]|nr:hypothetical protein [Anaerolineaceae bacterium]